jgi:nucleoid-associated protein YgaU
MLIDVRMPRPHELVGSLVTGLQIQTAIMFYGTGGSYTLRIVDDNGAVLARQTASGAGSGEFGGPLDLVFTLPTIPSTIDGRFEILVGLAGSDSPIVSVPIQFGAAISDQYMSFVLHTVQPGESLYAIAELEYQYGGGGALWNQIYLANRHQVSDPNLIHPGQVLLVPLTTTTQYDHG